MKLYMKKIHLKYSNYKNPDLSKVHSKSERCTYLYINKEYIVLLDKEKYISAVRKTFLETAFSAFLPSWLSQQYVKQTSGLEKKTAFYLKIPINKQHRYIIFFFSGNENSDSR